MKNTFTSRVRRITVIVSLFTTCFLVCQYAAQAQMAYTISRFSNTYTAISAGGGATAATAAQANDGTTSNVTLPFTFTFNGNAQTAISICSNGWAAFGNTSVTTSTNTSFATTTASTVPINLLAPWFDDLTAATSATVLYQTQGTSPNRTFTMQWGNVTYNGGSRTMNFQVILYETTNVIEFQYGAVSSGTPNGAESATIGIKGAGSLNGFIDATTGSQLFFNAYLNSDEFPSNRFFRFTPGAPTALSAGTYTVGNGGTYPSLAEAVADVNQRGMSGNVILQLTDSAYTNLNNNSSGGYNMFPIAIGNRSNANATLTIIPAAGSANLRWEGSAAGGMYTMSSGSSTTTTTIANTGQEPVIQLVGSKYVKIKNVNLYQNYNGYSSNNLLDAGFELNNIDTLSANTNSVTGTQHDTLQGFNIVLNNTNTGSIGVNQQLQFTPVSVLGASSYNSYRDFTIYSVGQGIQFNGNSSYPDLNNEIGTSSPASYSYIGSTAVNNIGSLVATSGNQGINGIRANTENNLTIHNCVIRNLCNASYNVNAVTSGIYVNSGGNTTIYNNKIYNILDGYTGSSTNGSGGAISGHRANTGIFISLNVSSAVAKIYNNFISNVRDSVSAVQSAFGYLSGIAMVGSTSNTTYDVDFNSISMNAFGTNEMSSSDIYMNSAAPVHNIRDNVLSNTMGNPSSGTSYHVCVYSTTANSATSIGASGSTCNYNDLYTDGASDAAFGDFSSTTYTTLTAWRGTTAAPDANSLNILPGFTSKTDLHDATNSSLQAGSFFSNAITWVTADIDGDLRGSTPYIGADELGCTAPSTPSSVVLTPGNNSISGVITPGSASSGYIVLRTTINTAPTAPSSGTTYTASSTFNNTLNAYIDYVGTSASFTTTGLTIGTYYYWVYAYNAGGSGCVGAPYYSTGDATANGSPLIPCTSSNFNSGTISATNTALCLTGTTVLSLNGVTTTVTGLTYQWDSSAVSGGPYVAVTKGTGATATSYSTPTLTSTVYYICNVTCSNTSTVIATPQQNISVSTPVTVSSSSGSGVVCSGNTITYTASSNATSYSWAPGSDLNTSTGSVVIATPASAVVYTVTATLGSCVSTATVAAAAYSTPVISNVIASPAAICSGSSILSYTTAAASTYGFPDTHNQCTTNSAIGAVTFGSSGAHITLTGGKCNGVPDYKDFSSDISVTGLTGTYTAGSAYTLSVTTGGSEIGVWIDYNQDGVFSADEMVYASSNSANSFSPSIVIPSTALNGTTRMRVRSVVGTVLTGTNANTAFSSTGCEAYDFTITISGSAYPSYTWASTAGTVSTASSISVSPTATTTYTLTLNNGCSTALGSTTVSVGAPLSAAINTGGPNAKGICTPVSGGTATTSSNALNTSTTIFGDFFTVTRIYPGGNGISGVGDTTGTPVMNNTMLGRGAGSPFYKSYMSNPVSGVTTATLSAGSTYTFMAHTDEAADIIANVWIDFNDNGVFDSLTERVVAYHNFNVTSLSPLTYNASLPAFIIPSTAQNGTHVMRIVSWQGNPHPYIPSCGETAITRGTADDYLITITGGSNAGCAGTNTYMTAVPTGGGGTYTYAWAPATGLSATTGATVYTTTTTTQAYTVTVSDNCTNTAQAVDSVKITALPNVSVTPPSSSLCSGSSGIALLASGALSYSWTPATGLSATTGASLTANPSYSLTYTVTGSSNGCAGGTSVVTVPITVTPAPTISSIMATPSSICSGKNSTLSYAKGTVSYTTPKTAGCNNVQGTGQSTNWIDAVTFGKTAPYINNSGTGCNGSPESFISYTTIIGYTGTYKVDSTYSISVTNNNNNQGVAIWIDYNQDGNYTPDELVYQSATASLFTYTGSITIPHTAFVGTTRMRVRAVNSVIPSSVDASTNYALGGETEDYTITITGGSYPAYSWASSLGTVSTASSVTVSPTTTTTYTLTVTDACTSVTGNTTVLVGQPISSSITSGTSGIYNSTSYCTPSQSTGLNSTAYTSTRYGDYFSNMTIRYGNTTLMSNNTGRYPGSPMYESFMASPVSGTTTAILTAGNTYTLRATPGVGGTTENTSVWIDFNDNGVFESTEEIVNAANLGVSALGLTDSTTFTMPAGVNNGTHAMRVIMAYTNLSAGITACGSTYPQGSADDYFITISGGLNCTNSSVLTTVTSGGGSNYTYAWSPSTGLNSTNAATVVSTPTANTTYTVTVTDSCNNTTTATIYLPSTNVYVTPTSGSYCSGGGGVNFTAGNALTYTWTPSAGLSATTGATVSASPTSIDIYTVTGTTAGGCMSTATATAAAYPTPVISSATATPAYICSGNSTTLSYTSPVNYYCVPYTTRTAQNGNGCADYYISAVVFGSTAPYINTSTTCNGNALGYVGYLTTTSNYTGTYTAGSTYTITINGNQAQGFAVWIDYNHDGTFSNDEMVYQSTISTSSTTSGSIAIPSLALNGATHMRVRSEKGAIPASTEACTNYAIDGETEDYTITITGGSNPTYVWQSASGVVSTSSVVTVSPSVTTTYTLIVSNALCTATANNTVTVGAALSASATTGGAAINTATYAANIPTQSSSSNISPYTSTRYGDYFSNIKISSGNTTLMSSNTNSYPCSAFYTSFMSAPVTGATTATLTAGNTYTLTATPGESTQAENTSIWIDFNDDGVFSSSERLVNGYSFLVSAYGLSASTTFTLPAGVQNGTHAMRILDAYNTAAASITPNGTTYARGAAYDYLITITGGITSCAGTNAVLTATTTGGGGPYTYSWAPSTGLSVSTGSSIVSTATTTTTYTVTITDNCSHTTTATSTLSIDNPTAAFSPYTTLSICTGPTVLPIALTGKSPWTVVYNDGTNHTLTSATASYILSVNPLTTTIYKIRSVSDADACAAVLMGTSVNAYADSIRKVALFAPKGGSVTPALSTICSGSNQTFSVVGDSGTNIQWQYSTNPNSVSWTSYGTYDSTSATLSNVTSITYVRAVISTPGCVSVASTDGEVKLDSSAITVGISNISATAATVYWTPALGATSYTIVYNGNTVVAGNVTSYNLTGLSSCTAYSVSVTSNTSNCGGARSGSGSFNTPTGNLSLSLSQGVTYKVTATWNAGVGPYKLYIGSAANLNSLQVFNVTGTSYTTKNAWPGYSVAAYVVDLGSTCTPLAQSALMQINMAGGNCTAAAPVITARATSATTFTVQWSGSATGYQFYYKNTNGSGSWYSYYTAGNSMTINGCAPGNCYAVYVQNVCGTAKGYATTVDTVCTAAACTAPLNLILSKATCNGFTATWNSVAGATAYQVFMTVTAASGSPIVYSYTVTGSPYTVAIFGRSVPVSVYVKTLNCTGSNGISAASNVESITTLATACKDDGSIGSNDAGVSAAIANGTFSVYPNPNNGTFKVSMATLSTNSTATLEVMDLLGRTLYTKEVSNNNGTIVETIDMGNAISSGLYMVRVRCGNDTHIAKVQIQR